MSNWLIINQISETDNRESLDGERNTHVTKRIRESVDLLEGKLFRDTETTDVLNAVKATLLVLRTAEKCGLSGCLLDSMRNPT